MGTISSGSVDPPRVEVATACTPPSESAGVAESSGVVAYGEVTGPSPAGAVGVRGELMQISRLQTYAVVIPRAVHYAIKDRRGLGVEGRDYIIFRPCSTPKSWQLDWKRPRMDAWNNYSEWQTKFWQARLAPGSVEEVAGGFFISGLAYIQQGYTNSWQWWWTLEEPWLGGYVHPLKIECWLRNRVWFQDSEANRWVVPWYFMDGKVCRPVPWHQNGEWQQNSQGTA